MTLHQALHRLLVAWPLIAAVGCASAYHDYPCGDVPYEYCPPQPLPYTGYETCPTPIAKCYLAEGPPDASVTTPIPEPVAPGVEPY